MASSGMRLGGFVGLRDGDIRPIYYEATGKKLIAAHVVVYKGEEIMNMIHLSHLRLFLLTKNIEIFG